MTTEKTFGNGYTYQDLVQTCAHYAVEGTGSLRLGIEQFTLNEYMMEFNTDLTYEEILSHFGRTLKEFKCDVVGYYREVKRGTGTAFISL